MADQPPIRDVVLRCRDCKQEIAISVSDVKPLQQCESYQCKHAELFRLNISWSGWEIAHITRAEAG